jgi:hypothetical protein
VDIRDFKKKSITCPDSRCRNKFDIEVQRGVDIAIVMKAMKACVANQLDTVVLIAGDGDFGDLVEYLTQQLYQTVWVFGYDGGSMSPTLFEKGTPFCMRFLDKIWNKISVPYDNSPRMGRHRSDESYKHYEPPKREHVLSND